MYGIFTYIYHENQPNVGKYTIHGSYGRDSGQQKFEARFVFREGVFHESSPRVIRFAMGYPYLEDHPI